MSGAAALAGYRAHSRTPAFARHDAAARTFVRQHWPDCARPYVAFSAGKDSSVLLDLVVSEVAGPVTARILTSGESRLMHASLDQILDWWRQRHPRLDLQEINVDRVFADGWQDADWHTQRKRGKSDIRELLPQGRDGVWLGLRADESGGRRMSLRSQGLVYQYAGTRTDPLAGTWRFCPLAWWSDRDVASYCVTHGLPLPQAYAWTGIEATRTTMRLTGDAMRGNALQQLRVRDPERFRALLARFPETSWWAG